MESKGLKLVWFLLLICGTSGMFNNETDESYLSYLDVEDELKQAKANYENIRSDNETDERFKRGAVEDFTWQNKGVLSDVEQQLRCGSCYAFTTSGAVETALAIRYGQKMPRLSKQQIVDCTRNARYRNRGCNGGSVRSAFQYIKDVGLMKDQEYPYKNRPGFFCRVSRIDYDQLYKISSFRAIGYRREQEIMSAIRNIGPVVSYISATSLRYNYGKGIYSNRHCKNSPINHVVLLVGYGTDQETGEDYWVIKNSWGKAWADRGYGRIKRGENTCNIEALTFYPIV